jgi:hypothetical protein
VTSRTPRKKTKTRFRSAELPPIQLPSPSR